MLHVHTLHRIAACKLAGVTLTGDSEDQILQVVLSPI